MSASEKLQKLETTTPPPYSNWAAMSSEFETAPNGLAEWYMVIRNVLPEVIAVVVAAEWTEQHGGCIYDTHGLGEALAALDTKLTL